jgi:hypothetical protein
MVDQITNSISGIPAIVLIGAAVAVIVAMVLFLRSRARHIRRLRAEVLGEVPVSGGLREAISKAFNVSTAELTTVGAVTFADLAWQYSLAEPQIWDHFQGPAADHMVNAIQNLDVLRSTLGNHSQQVFVQVLESLKHIEATHIFQELAERIPALESAGLATSVAIGSSGQTLVDALASLGGASLEAKGQTAATVAAAAGDGSLLYHVPLVTIGFATYRAWRRAQQGAEIKRNVEFAAIEVATRAGGALVGGQIGGVIGTAIVPGLGTILGGVVGAIGGTIAGMRVGEDVRSGTSGRRASSSTSFCSSWAAISQDPIRYKQLTSVFVEHERSICRA